MRRTLTKDTEKKMTGVSGQSRQVIPMYRWKICLFITNMAEVFLPKKNYGC